MNFGSNELQITRYFTMVKPCCDFESSQSCCFFIIIFNRASRLTPV